MANTGFLSPLISTLTSKPSPTPSLALFPPHHHPGSLRFSWSFLEELVRRTNPAVLGLKALGGTGSGFFITDTGVIATNARVARGDSTLLALLPDGTQLQASAVYIDPDLDLALVKACAIR
jgi:S1-C subfamily serine protease